MVGRLIRNRAAVGTIGLVLIVALIGIFAPFIAPNDPYATDILNKFAGFSQQYPLGTDNLGRCILSRMIYGIRPTLGLGVQAPTPEWGAMLSEAKNVLTSNPVQMLVPGIAVVILVAAFNLMGDALRDVLDPKEVQK